MQMELLTSALEFPEGPVAMADGSVLLVEIRRQTLSRVRPNGAVEVVAELPGGPNGAAIGPDGAAYVCNNGGFEWNEDGHTLGYAARDYAGGSIQRVDLDTGEVTTLYRECEGRKLVGPNDIVFDSQGGFWFSDLGKGTPEGHLFGGLYYALPDGSKITRQRERTMSLNGVGLSPNEKVLYAADTFTGRLWAVDLSGPGEASPAGGPGMSDRVIATLPGYQMLDSLAVEAGGKVCVATIVNGGITIFDPNGSTEHVAFPDPHTTNICFGGADLRDAWVTCSGAGALYKCRWPRPGLRLAFNR